MQWIYRDALKAVAELDGAGVLIAQFAYASKFTTPDYVHREGNTYRVVSDNRGSPRYVVNATTASDVPFTASYSAFGEVAGVGLDWMPFGFAGGMYDADTGLVRFGSRDYDPALGRWMSKDPALFRGGLNLYRYANADPVNFIDPVGHWPFLTEWQFQSAWNHMMNPGPLSWPGLFPGEGPDWHHQRNRNQEGKCPDQQPESDSCGGGENWKNWGKGNPFHGYQTDLRSRGPLAGVQMHLRREW